MTTPQFVNRENLIADTEYIQWLSEVKKRFRQSQGRALVKVNAEMLEFYWSIGRDLVVLKAEARWGDGVVKQFALDMRGHILIAIVDQLNIEQPTEDHANNEQHDKLQYSYTYQTISLLSHRTRATCELNI